MTDLYDSGPPDWTVLDRYYAGDATDRELERVDSYFTAHPERRSVVQAIVQAVRRDATPTGRGNVGTMLSMAHQRIARTLSVASPARRPEYGRIEHAIAALLDADDATLTPDQLDELRRLIASAREEGR